MSYLLAGKCLSILCESADILLEQVAGARLEEPLGQAALGAEEVVVDEFPENCLEGRGGVVALQLGGAGRISSSGATPRLFATSPRLLTSVVRRTCCTTSRGIL